MIKFEEMISFIEGYPLGKYLYKLEVEGVTYYHFSNWIATEDMIREEWVKVIEDEKHS